MVAEPVQRRLLIKRRSCQEREWSEQRETRACLAEEEETFETMVVMVVLYSKFYSQLLRLSLPL